MIDDGVTEKLKAFIVATAGTAVRQRHGQQCGVAEPVTQGLLQGLLVAMIRLEFWLPVSIFRSSNLITASIEPMMGTRAS